MQRKKDKSIWAVVYVLRGMPAKIKLFGEAKPAYRHENYLRKRINLDYDETGIFIVDLSEVTSVLRGKAITLNALNV